MTERKGPDHTDNPDETSVFTPASERAAAKAAHDRPGSPTPPWQRGQQSGSDGASSSPDGHGPTSVMADQQTVAEQRPSYAPPMSGTVGGSSNGSPLSSVPNPFLTRNEPPAQQPAAPQPAAQQHPAPQGGQQPPPQQAGLGTPPRVQPGMSVPLGGPGAIPVGGPPGGAPHGGPSWGTARPTARPSAPLRGRMARAPRKASLQIRRFDPWSVLKLSLVLSVAMFLMWLVAVGVLYGVLDGMGVWDKLNGAYSDLASVNDTTGGGEPLISAGRVFGISAVVGVVNIVLFTAFATVAAFVYNVSADLAGGIEVTLSERD